MSITARGGYQIVDFKNIGISSTGTIIPGIYNQVRNVDKKPCWACNLTIVTNGTSRAIKGCQFIPALINNDEGETVTCVFNVLEGKAAIMITSDDNAVLNIIA